MFTVILILNPDKPVVTAVTEKLAVDINSTATLSCRARALPAPRFEWYHGNQHITGDGRTSLVSATPQPGGADVYEGRLSLRDVAASDLGKYRCVARNEIGNGMAQIQLTVKSKIIMLIFGENANIMSRTLDLTLLIYPLISESFKLGISYMCCYSGLMDMKL